MAIGLIRRNCTNQGRDLMVQEFLNKKIGKHHFPGIQYFVLNSNKIIFEYVGGWADVTNQKWMQRSTTMMIYSMTKTLTAAAILQLVENKKMILDDSVSIYLPDIPYDNQLNVRHLLCQTAGIPNPIPLKWAHLAEEHSSFDENAALIAVLKDYPQLVFKPGKKYAYSNISYWLLGKIIEKVSGLKYESYIRDNILTKLQISQNETDFIIPALANHSKGYLEKYSIMNLFKSFLIDAKYIGKYEDSWLHIRNHYLNGPSFGGLVSNAHSISKFLQDQLQEDSALFSRKTKDLFFQQQKNNNGDLISMTLGWHIGTINKLRYYFKEGGGGGFHSEVRIYPEQGIATVVIVNSTSFNSKDFLNIIDKEFYKEKPP